MGFKEKGVPLPPLPQNSIKTPGKGKRALPHLLITYFTRKSTCSHSPFPNHDTPIATRPREDKRCVQIASKLATTPKNTLPLLRDMIAREHRRYTWCHAEALDPCAAPPTTPNKHPRPLTIHPCEQE
jgi:hypothetical protein